MSWTRVAHTAEVQPGNYLQVDAGFTYLLICNVDGSFFAIEDRCTHDDSSLSGGFLAGDNIVCPRHGATFCVRNGAVTAPPAYEDVQTYPVRIVDGYIEVDVPA